MLNPAKGIADLLGSFPALQLGGVEGEVTDGAGMGAGRMSRDLGRCGSGTAAEQQQHRPAASAQHPACLAWL